MNEMVCVVAYLDEFGQLKFDLKRKTILPREAFLAMTQSTDAIVAGWIAGFRAAWDAASARKKAP